VQPAASAGRDLARDHRVREVPRRDRRAHAHRLLHHHDAAVGPEGRDHVAVDALGFLGEPLDVGRADPISPFASASGLPCSLVRMSARSSRLREHQVEPLAQDGRALLRQSSRASRAAPSRPPRSPSSCPRRPCRARCRAARRSPGCAPERSSPRPSRCRRRSTARGRASDPSGEAPAARRERERSWCPRWLTRRFYRSGRGGLHEPLFDRKVLKNKQN
jgi:hypothetical protein